MPQPTVSDHIAEFLYRLGVRQIFELSGGMITYLLDSLNRQNVIQVVSVHHEQAASFAADAAGRMTGIPGVAMATSGPGATNLLTGMGSCYFDSSPAVFITGQVNRAEQKGSRAIRQLGFQETDIVAMAGPVTKAAWKVETADEVPAMFERAFRLASEGRPGPVLIDIPMDIQRSTMDESAWRIEAPQLDRRAPEIDWAGIHTILAAAQRPLILAGGGIRSGRASHEFRQAVDLLGIPVVNSLMAVDCLPFQHPLRVGLIGTYGNRWANLALSEADVLLVLGSRLDVRQTGSRTAEFKGERTIIHVDCEAGEINNRVTGCKAIECELSIFLNLLLGEARQWSKAEVSGWRSRIESLREQWPDTQEQQHLTGICPNGLMHELSRSSGPASAFVADVGQHQMWAAQSLELDSSQRFLTSGGMGSMGFGLPAAIGAAVSTPGKPVVLIVGDGGFQCNIQELQTVARLGLPIKIVIVNNRCHGMVRQFQESYFEGRYQSTYWGYSAPEFAKVGQAYGIESRRIEQSAEIGQSLAWLWSDPDRPQLLEVMVDTFTNAYPKIAFGRPISDMEPLSKPVEVEST